MHLYIPKSTLRLLAVAVLFIGFAGYSFLNADWTPPTTTPPGNNVEAPINHGTSTASLQLGSGNLAFDQLTAFTEMNSDKYCSLLGDVCYNPVDVYNLLNASGTPTSVQRTQVSGWPDSIVCTVPNGPGMPDEQVVLYLVLTNYHQDDTYMFIYTAPSYNNSYNLLYHPDGTAYSGDVGDCTSKTINQLAASGQALSFNPQVFVPGTKSFIHLPDRGSVSAVVKTAIGVGGSGGDIYSTTASEAQVCTLALPGSHSVGFSTHAYYSPGNNSVFLFSSTAKAGYTSDKKGGWWQEVNASSYNSVIEDIWCQK